MLLCYSVVRRSSFESLRTKWCLEIREHDINLPIVLVGKDLDFGSPIWTIAVYVSGTDVEKRNDSASHVSSGEAENFGRLIGAFAFVECSVESFVGVDDVFIGAIRSVSSRYCRLRPLIKMKWEKKSQISWLEWYRFQFLLFQWALRKNVGRRVFVHVRRERPAFCC